MAEEKARIVASLDGANQVISDAKRMGDALKGVGEKTEEGKKKSESALKGLGKALSGAAEGALGMASSLLSVGASLFGIDLNLQRAMERAEQFDEVTARFGQTAKVSGKELQSSFQGLESKLLTSAPELASFAKTLSQMTYDPKGSMEALEGLGDEALATGKTLNEELDLGRMLHQGLGVVGSVTGELGRLRSMAEQVGTVGGHLAFKDELKSLTPILAQVNTSTEESRHQLEALVAVLGKGLKPQMATQVVASTLSMLKGRALDIERVTGRKVLDEYGQLINPLQNLKDIKRLSQVRFRNDKEARRRALIADFGQEAGLTLERTDFSEVDRLAQAQDTGQTKKEADTFRHTETGQRTQFQIEQERNMRKIGMKLLDFRDSALSSTKSFIPNMDVEKMLSLQEKLNHRRRNTDNSFFDGSGLSSTETLEKELHELREKYTTPITASDPVEKQEQEQERAIFFTLLKKRREEAETVLQNRRQGKESWLDQFGTGFDTVENAEQHAEAYGQVEDQFFPKAPSEPMSAEQQKAWQQVMKNAGEWMAQSFKDYLRTGEVVIRTSDPNGIQGNEW